MPPQQETCTVIRQGTLILCNTSLAVVLSAGTQCVFFGCYTKRLDYSWYQFKPVTLTIPPVSISKGGEFFLLVDMLKCLCVCVYVCLCVCVNVYVGMCV